MVQMKLIWSSNLGKMKSREFDDASNEVTGSEPAV
jgi:hypothetical protein